ncbi:MAG: protoporphyrinogen oxidase [Bacteroidetes bacterium HGW-Bacteroidetes-4]|jgi:oxygen-dependent protoporphyrinogen oxidase|nr:MAG: protoporphyrinogen oxidase [Bacteroidetes bacterium HGW-Bacteroidetes-4]
METQVDVIVLGAGLTGLSTAYHLNQASVKFAVLDCKADVGGVIATSSKNGFVFELGPNTGVVGSPEIAELLEALHPDCEVEYGNDKVSKRFILYKGKWQALPGGLWGGITTPLFTWKDKFRILGEPFRKKGTNPEETLADLVKRRMGNSFLDYAIDPFILGVYAGDPAYLIPKYALPKLYNLEQNYGSFIKGAIKKAKIPKTDREKKATGKIFTVKGGLGALTKTLYSKIGADKFLLGVSGIHVKPVETGFEVSLTNKDGDTVTLNAKKVISTLPAFELPKILGFVDEHLLNQVSQVFHPQVVEIAVGFNQWKGVPIDGFGGLIPFKEKREIMGVMYMSSLFENRAPEGGALITVFVGGARRQDLPQRSDEELKALVAKEFKELMGVPDFKPDLFEIIRHKHAIPQYGKESKARFEAVEKIQTQFPGLLIGGNLRNGIGMSDRVKQGTELAHEIIAVLK